MIPCSRKLVDGASCPQPALRKATLQARGMSFQVPVCRDCHALLNRKQDHRNQDPSVTSLFENIFGKSQTP